MNTSNETAKPQNPCLLLVSLQTKEFPDALIDRAGLVAKRLGLDVLVYSPLVQTEPPDAEVAAQSGTEGELLKIGRDHAAAVASALFERGVTAAVHVDFAPSALQGAANVARSRRPALIMLSVEDYLDWTKWALVDSDVLDDCHIPVWLAQDAWSEGPILAALPASSSETPMSPLENSVAEHASNIASQLGRDVHALHVIPENGTLARVLEAVVPDDKIDASQQATEDESVARVADTTQRHRIAKEHVHIQHGDFLGAMETFVLSVPVGLIVVGPDQRAPIVRSFAQSTQQRLVSRLPADLLIVNPQSP